MRLEQSLWTEENGWQRPSAGLGPSAQLVFIFSSTTLIKQQPHLARIQAAYPRAQLFGCSTAGEIHGTEVHDHSLTITAVHFEYTESVLTHVKIRGAEDSLQAGETLGRALAKSGLAHVLVLSEGLHINGSDLVEGLMRHLPSGVAVTGGLSGDGERFKETYVLWEGQALQNCIAAVGLYGSRLRVGYSSLGGWDSFGPERLITRAQGNVLYEMDGKSALELYKKYLGDHAHDLPASGLLFPLSLRTREGETGVVRTILAINEQEQSLTFAGDIPAGAYARLMKANFDRLIDGASGAAKVSHAAMGHTAPQLALLISCVGRKMVLKQRIEEEVEGVREVLGPGTVLTGFYSYGEISPFTPSAKCELHNQTMTITTFAEE